MRTTIVLAVLVVLAGRMYGNEDEGPGTGPPMPPKEATGQAALKRAMAGEEVTLKLAGWRVTCGECGCAQTNKGTVLTTGSRSVPGGIVREQSVQFKCRHCKRVGSQRLEDWFVPDRGEAKPVVKVEVKGAKRERVESPKGGNVGS